MSKALKNYLKYLNLFKNPPAAENSHHAETSQSTQNASKEAGCNITRVQNQKRLQNRPQYN